MTDTDSTMIAADELVLDPFAYQPGMASAIVGLGGLTRHPDPSYAFHTDYVHAAEGPCCFTVRFRGLTAKTGTLQLRVHMFVDDSNPRLMLGNSWRGQFNWLIHNGSETAIRFDGFKDVRYALCGNILGGTDAAAEELTVTLDRPGQASDVEHPVAELRNSEFGRHTTRAEAMMVSIESPVLALPVGQAATQAQAREPVYEKWCAKLGYTPAPSRSGWAGSYVLQCLQVYGMLQPGVRAVGFGTDAEILATALRDLGVDAGAEPAGRSPDDLPGLVVNRDVLWSIDHLGRFGVHEAANLGLAMMRCLRPGGLAVHVFPFSPGLNQRDRAGSSGTFARSDIERLSIFMISRLVETAQVKIACDQPIMGTAELGGPEVGAFGLVLRKPPITGA